MYQQCDFVSLWLRALFVSLWLVHATILNLAVLLVDRGQICVCGASVRCQLGDLCVKTLEFLGLVLDILLLGVLADFVCLRVIGVL